MDCDADGPAASLPSSPPQVRSRITVVCAECKRLKLKCDRRTPCGSCLKRDTVARCVYSPAAAEKVDLHSLNNRLIHVEALLAQYAEAGGPQCPAPTGHAATAPAPFAARTAPLSIPLPELHAAFLADLGLPLPSLARVRVKTEPTPAPAPFSPSASSAAPLQPSPALLNLLPPPPRLPARLAAAHAALSALGAAPFPFAWLDARVYPFLSALAAAPDPAKVARRRARAANRERALLIFAGGRHAAANAGEDSESEVDELADGVRLHAPRARRGDPRMAFFALLCAVLALSADGEEGDEAALAQRAAEEYFAGAGADDSASSENENEREQAQADVDAVLALWVLGVRMMRDAAAGTGAGMGTEGGRGLEGVYVHLARTVAHARVVGLDPASSPSYSSSSAYTSAHSYSGSSSSSHSNYAASHGYQHASGSGAHSGSYANANANVNGVNGNANAQANGNGSAHASGRKRRAGGGAGVVKTEEGGEWCEEREREQMDARGGQMDTRGEGGRDTREEEVLRRRTWWAVVWGDVLVSDALGLAASSSSSSPTQNQHRDDEALDAREDWEEEGGGGRRFGAGVRLAQLLQRLPPGADGEGAVRRWEARELALLEASASVSSAGADGDDGREVGRERAELQLLANRAVLRGFCAGNGNGGNPNSGNGNGYAPNPNPNPNPSQQAVFGAVGAAHGIVQACRALVVSAHHALAAAAPTTGGTGNGAGFSPTAHVSPVAQLASPTSLTSLAALCPPTPLAPPAPPAPPTPLAHLATAPARALFDAGVVCAHAALRHPGAVFAPGARAALLSALALLREGALDLPAHGSAVNATAHVNANAMNAPAHAEAVRVLEALWARVEGGAPAPPARVNELKRKHDLMLGAGAGVGAGAGAAHEIALLALSPKHVKEQEAVQVQAKELQAKERDGGKDGKDGGKEKERKKRAYPTVGIRVRPGREALGVVVGAGPGAGAGRKASKGEGAGYYQPQPQQQQQPPPALQQQQQMPMEMEQYRSRSSSISQQNQMEYAAYPPAPAQEEYRHAQQQQQQQHAQHQQQQQQQQQHAQQHPAQQQQGYAGDATSAAMYDLQPRAGSYEVGSPYGTGASTASSPYTTTSGGASTSVSGGLATPTFQGQSPPFVQQQQGQSPPFGAQQGQSPPFAQQGQSPPFGAQQGQSPPFAQQGQSPPFGAQQGQSPPGYAPFYATGYEAAAAGYDAHGHGHGHGMALDSLPGYESGGGKAQQMYEVKPLLEHHHHQHGHGGFHAMEAPDAREMVWPPPEAEHGAQQYWASADEYKFYPQ